ncbi:MAG TPA: exodeoxyribonuclease VII large subunit [Candidatus Saccharimonadales bacterium]|nr:exodeoxyribonuclease VII large subunit [Candidatus Saccharimonadales bacterium]
MSETDASAEVILGVSDFVAVLNQTLDYAYPQVTVMGELANLRVSKGRWLYFDLKDEISTVKFFGTVRQLPGPLEDGMILKVRGAPRLHHQYGFSVNVFDIRPAGEGTIKRAAQLLKAKLAKEGLFDEARKRQLPYPPSRIGLVASKQSAAYADFVKILGARWRGVTVDFIDVQVQGDAAPDQLVAALARLNALAEPPEVAVLIRGGGSAEDLAAYNTEVVARAVAGSRVPTLVAIGHETDLSLAELAADRRASTPSNAAELLVPDRGPVLAEMRADMVRMERCVTDIISSERAGLASFKADLSERSSAVVNLAASRLDSYRRLLEALNPEAILRRGYAIVREVGSRNGNGQGRPLRAASQLAPGAIVDVRLAAGRFNAEVTEVKEDKP